jgi:hypothetical protein
MYIFHVQEAEQHIMVNENIFALCEMHPMSRILISKKEQSFILSIASFVSWYTA